MPYKFKGKKDCKQSDGSKGKYLTVKKDGSKRCYKSEKQYKTSQAFAHESDELGQEEGQMVTEKKLREMIRLELKSTFKNVKEQIALREAKEDKDLNLDELEGLSLPPVLKKLLDPNISPAKYADVDQLVDASGNVNHQAFAIAAFVLNYADMDDGIASSILIKTKSIIPKILAARKSGGEDQKVDQEQ